jgi:hypothetical protein
MDHAITETGTLARKETNLAQGLPGCANRSSESDEVQVQGQRFFLWDKRAHPFMSLFCIHPFRNEPETLPDSVDMRIHWEGLSSQAKEKKAVKRLRTDPLKGADRFLDFFGIHLSQKGKAQFPFLFLDPMKNFTDASGLLLRQPTRPDG